jgi:hypothetical protein
MGLVVPPVVKVPVNAAATKASSLRVAVNVPVPLPAASIAKVLVPHFIEASGQSFPHPVKTNGIASASIATFKMRFFFKKFLL